MLPAWLGSDNALQDAVDKQQLPLINEMRQQWPFFEPTSTCWKWWSPKRMKI